MKLVIFSRSHQESLLVLCALVFLVALAAYVAWAIAALTGDLARAITVEKGDGKGATFHFEELKALKLPGIE
ncbi:MAG: hypothetical protein HYW65_04175 [Candidatus Liptonbacteria bacterium]|nr:hypothetical protein [Candidatus Liptonbacteria bacterium]